MKHHIASNLRYSSRGQTANLQFATYKNPAKYIGE